MVTTLICKPRPATALSNLFCIMLFHLHLQAARLRIFLHEHCAFFYNSNYIHFALSVGGHNTQAYHYNQPAREYYVMHLLTRMLKLMEGKVYNTVDDKYLKGTSHVSELETLLWFLHVMSENRQPHCYLQRIWFVLYGGAISREQLLVYSTFFGRSRSEGMKAGRTI